MKTIHQTMHAGAPATNRGVLSFRTGALVAVKLTVCLFLFSFLVSCNKDDDEDDFRSFINIRGTEYDLTKGIYEVTGYKSTNANEVCLFLYSGYTNVSIDGGSLNAKGVGDGIAFYLICPEGDLTPHDYIPKWGGESYTCSDIAFFTETSATTGKFALAGEGLNDGSGLISIDKKGEIYTITFNFNAYVENWDGTLYEEITVTGQFKGKIPESVK